MIIKPKPVIADERSAALYEPGRPLNGILELLELAEPSLGKADLFEVPVWPVLLIRFRERLHLSPEAATELDDYVIVEAGQYVIWAPGIQDFYTSDPDTLDEFYDVVNDDE